jgi:hypothetical protein
MLKKSLILMAVLAVAGFIGWKVAQPGDTPAVTTEPTSSKSGSLIAGSPSSVGSSPAPAPKTGWVPPEGDPVKKYQAAKTKQERYDVISNFMALGHEKNPFMLVEALKDPDTSNRVYSVESASALTPEEATHVLRKAAINDRWDVREMGWSLLAPFPVEHKAEVFAEVITNGADESLTEAFGEMGRQPDIQLFDTMVSLSQKAPTGRQNVLLKEMQVWLEPGGGEVPQFRSVQEVLPWWQANRKNYDEYMLRVDQ